MAQVWLRLEALAQQHGITDALQVFVRVRPHDRCRCACAASCHSVIRLCILGQAQVASRMQVVIWVGMPDQERFQMSLADHRCLPWCCVCAGRHRVVSRCYPVCIGFSKELS